MRTYYTPHHAGHAPRIEQLHGHTVPYFESPTRIDVLLEALTEAGLVDIHEPETLISENEIAKTHNRKMITHLRYLSENVETIIREEMGIYGLENLIRGDEYFYESIFPTKLMRAKAGPDARETQRGFYIFDSTAPVGRETYSAIVHSATLAHQGARALLGGEQHVYAMCRPPGHHAGRDFAGGYCFFNNAGIAANVLRNRGKVAILDVDYHHGNGTQAIFWDDPSVLYVSIHADPAVDYPYYAGYADEDGGEAAEGLTINYPLPLDTDQEMYLNTLDQALDDIREFEPATLIISLGFDIVAGDPMARFKMHEDGFKAMGERIAALNYPTLYVQEGGYDLDQIGTMAVAFFKGVNNA